MKKLSGRVSGPGKVGSGIPKYRVGNPTLISTDQIGFHDSVTKLRYLPYAEFGLAQNLLKVSKTGVKHNTFLAF